MLCTCFARADRLQYAPSAQSLSLQKKFVHTIQNQSQTVQRNITLPDAMPCILSLRSSFQCSMLPIISMSVSLCGALDASLAAAVTTEKPSRSSELTLT